MNTPAPIQGTAEPEPADERIAALREEIRACTTRARMRERWMVCAGAFSVAACFTGAWLHTGSVICIGSIPFAWLMVKYVGDGARVREQVKSMTTDDQVALLAPLWRGSDRKL